MWWYSFILLPAAVLLWLAYEWIEHTWVQYVTTEVECRNIPENQEIKICLVSDLHNNKKNLQKLLEQIHRFAPEFILLAGDIVDKHKAENSQAEAFLQTLSELDCPVYYSVGNHEATMMEKQPEAWRTYMERIGHTMIFLNNQSVCTTVKSVRFAISGLSLTKSFYKKGTLYENERELPELSVPEHEFHILLAHNPEYAELYHRYHANLVVSGHLHGGLVRLPFVGGLISPRLRLTKKDAGLVSLSQDSSMFISRGLGSHTIPLRFFNRVEVNFLVLKGVAEKKVEEAVWQFR